MGEVNIEPVRQNAVRLSNRQFSLLKMVKSIRSHTITVDEIASMNQITVGSLVRSSRRYLKETRSRDGLYLTPEGERAIRAFEGADFFRKVQSFHFSGFLHLKVPNTERTVKAHHKSAAA